MWEQPEVLAKNLQSEKKVISEAANHIASQSIDRIYLTGCGDSVASLIAVRALYEELLGIQCEALQALDFTYYYNRPINERSLVITLSSSGNTVRTVEAMLVARARGANTLYKVRLDGITTGQKLDQTFKGNDFLEGMDLERRPVSFLYRAQKMYTFMDEENYEQYTLSEESLEGRAQWLIEGLEGISALLLEGKILGVALPASVDLEITETAPAIKGATVTNRNKPATLSNGVTVQVPEYLSAGEIVRVNTETGKYMSRAKG